MYLIDNMTFNKVDKWRICPKANDFNGYKPSLYEQKPEK